MEDSQHSKTHHRSEASKAAHSELDEESHYEQMIQEQTRKTKQLEDALQALHRDALQRESENSHEVSHLTRGDATELSHSKKSRQQVRGHHTSHQSHHENHGNYRGFIELGSDLHSAYETPDATEEEVVDGENAVDDAVEEMDGVASADSEEDGAVVQASVSPDGDVELDHGSGPLEEAPHTSTVGASHSADGGSSLQRPQMLAQVEANHETMVSHLNALQSIAQEVESKDTAALLELLRQKHSRVDEMRTLQKDITHHVLQTEQATKDARTLTQKAVLSYLRWGQFNEDTDKEQAEKHFEAWESKLEEKEALVRALREKRDQRSALRHSMLEEDHVVTKKFRESVVKAERVAGSADVARERLQVLKSVADLQANA